MFKNALIYRIEHWDQPTLTNAVNHCINTSKDDSLLHIGNTPKNPGLCGIPVP